MRLDLSGYWILPKRVYLWSRSRLFLAMGLDMLDIPAVYHPFGGYYVLYFAAWLLAAPYEQADEQL